MRHNETHRTPPKTREECGLFGEGGTYGNIAGSLENVKQKVERNDCSDVGGGERKSGSPILLILIYTYVSCYAMHSIRRYYS